MTFKTGTVALVLAATVVAAPTSAFAFGLGFGCTDLPELYRARGALQGMTSACDMSLAEARRIVAAYEGTAAVPSRAPPAPRVSRHHRHRLPPRG